MVFSSTLFLFLFLPVVLIFYHMLKERYQNYWLLLVSLIFFAWSQPNYFWLILLSILINYISGMIMATGRLRKLTLILCLLANLGLLIYFKYFDFLIASFNSIFHGSVGLKNIVLPIGISFFTFQGMSYAIDVFRCDAPAQKNPLKVALYIVLFPQLIAGPIVRYTEVSMEIDQRSTSLDDMAYGIQRFIIGLAKKSVIANTMAAIVDNIWNCGGGSGSVSVAWLGSIAYTLQIYYDFSGYSDMAIGLGRMFGFHFGENFNFPYISKSITEFWRRWHISLSSWFRDYVYIPLGGNRKRVYLNLTIVFLLTGLWHGASWNFIVWGIWNGAFILLERFLTAQTKEKPVSKSPYAILRWCYTIFVVNLGWVLFRAETLGAAAAYIGNMFGVVSAKTGYTIESFLDGWSYVVLIVGILFSTDVPSRIAKAITAKIGQSFAFILKVAFVIFLLFISMIRVTSGTYNPFIYFRF